MALYKRGKVWWVHFHSPSGERIRRSTRTSIKGKAQEFHDRLKSEYWEQEVLGKKPDYTWKDAVVKWLSEKEHKACLLYTSDAADE